MPLEIKELHIRVNVQQENAKAEGANSTPSTSAGSEQAIIAACVEQVLEILKEKKER